MAASKPLCITILIISILAVIAFIVLTYVFANKTEPKPVMITLFSAGVMLFSVLGTFFGLILT